MTAVYYAPSKATYDPTRFDISDPETYPPNMWPCWHVHHNALVEPVFPYSQNSQMGGFAERLGYILDNKPTLEISTRIRLIRPVKNIKRYVFLRKHEHHKEYVNNIVQLHDEECPNCPWNGHSIFPPSFYLPSTR